MSDVEGALDDEALDEAVRVLRRGGLVAFPTETVYGLGADASQPDAVRRVFTVKGRPLGHPVIVHLASAGDLDRWARHVPAGARVLADACWPGPLTLVLPRRAEVPDVVTGGRDSVGLRVPAQPLALELLRRFGGGLAAPSANRFGRVSPTTAEHVRRDLGDDIDLVLDGGPCTVGVESTIVELTGDEPVLLRPGGVPAERLDELLGRPVRRTPQGPARAPGMLPAHYAPRARVVLADAAHAEDELARAEAGGRRARLLHPGVDAAAWARSLYAWLREADADGIEVLVVVPPPEEGLGVAVVDRLRRAAAGSGGSGGPMALPDEGSVGT